MKDALTTSFYQRKGLYIFFISMGFMFFHQDMCAQKKPIPPAEMQFIAEMLPLIRIANADVAAERQLIYNSWVSYIKNGELTKNEEETLDALGEAYHIKPFQPDSDGDLSALPAYFDDLLLHIDIIPEKLVLAQAIVESAWGKSRFAREANNYFGIHCYSEGCGLPPARAQEAGFEVKRYENKLRGVKDYIKILNTNLAYQELRQMRLDDRKKIRKPNPIDLANGLSRYSEQGSKYIRILHAVIKNYIPDNLDAFMRSQSKEYEASASLGTGAGWQEASYLTNPPSSPVNQ